MVVGLLVTERKPMGFAYLVWAGWFLVLLLAVREATELFAGLWVVRFAAGQ